MKSLGGFSAAGLRPGDRVCCALSGGADSVALLRALREANEEKQPLGVVLRAVHVHHGLRGAEADADEAFVRDLCARLGVELRVERVDTPARQQEASEGMEAAARHLRYEVFWRLLAEGWADLVVTAHTLEDQAETVLMKLLRGAWTEGLGGISPVLRAPAPAGRGWPAGAAVGVGAGAGIKAEAGTGRIVRPLLRTRRAEVERFLRERDQPWREDSSNRDPQWLRNRVRHELLPALRTVNPQLDEALARTAEIARDEETYWQGEVQRLLGTVLLPGRPVRGGGRAVSTAPGAGSLALELERLRGQPPAVQRRLVRAAAARLGCRPGAEDTGRLLQLAGLGEGDGPQPRVGIRIGARLELAGGLRAERSARELQLSRSGTHTAEDVEPE